ncbi:hypothetical protein FRX31_010772, partial [Thalictrum thalictroides]
MSSTTDWHDDDDEEIGKLEAEIRNKYGDGSLEKLRRRRVNPDGTRLGSRVSNMGSNMNKETQVQIQTGAEILVSKEPHNNDGSGLVVAGVSEDDASASGKRTSSVIIQPLEASKETNGVSISNGGIVQEDDGAVKASSWALVLGRSSVSKTSLTYEPPSIVDGKPVVHFKTEEFSQLSESYAQL